MNLSTVLNSSGRVLLSIALAASILMLAACTSPPPAPDNELAVAREAITGAEQAGARQHAGAELDTAQQKLVQAEKAVAREEMASAERLAREAAIVAELAAARTEAAKAAAINREMERGADALDEKMRRTGDPQ